MLDQLIRDVPWDIKSDKIVFLGDLVDRGIDVPGVLDRVMKIATENPRVVVLRGNHEQMLLDCLDYGDLQWLIPENGGLATLKGYGMDLAELQDVTDIHIPQEHIDFMRGLPFFPRGRAGHLCSRGVDTGRAPVRHRPRRAVVDSRHGFLQGL